MCFQLAAAEDVSFAFVCNMLRQVGRKTPGPDLYPTQEPSARRRLNATMGPWPLTAAPPPPPPSNAVMLAPAPLLPALS